MKNLEKFSSTARSAILLLITVSVAFGAFGRLPDGRLDQKSLRAAYMESEFKKVASALESFRKASPASATKMDWVFAYKYLGVIYAADSTQSTRAEQNFNQLLTLSPNIELVDMYAPAKIQALFNEVKAEHRKRIEYESRFDPLGNPIRPVEPADSAKPQISPNKSSKKWLWWTTAGVAVGAGAGVLVWFQYFRDSGPKGTTVK